MDCNRFVIPMKVQLERSKYKKAVEAIETGSIPEGLTAKAFITEAKAMLKRGSVRKLRKKPVCSVCKKRGHRKNSKVCPARIAEEDAEANQLLMQLMELNQLPPPLSIDSNIQDQVEVSREPSTNYTEEMGNTENTFRQICEEMENL